jgi:signal transduction histidine kinase
MTLRGVSLAEVVTRCLTLTGARLRATGVQTRVELPDSLQRVWADPDRLEQVLVNLVNNAIDAMSGAGELRIGARVQGDRVLLSVADTGEGIPEENLKRIFDPFFSTKPGKGTGLGLSISYGIVRDHGGSVWVESQPGEGSTFFISLPTEVES